MLVNNTYRIPIRITRNGAQKNIRKATQIDGVAAIKLTERRSYSICIESHCVKSERDGRIQKGRAKEE